MWNTCPISRMGTFDKILGQIEQKKTTPPCIIAIEFNLAALDLINSISFFALDFDIGRYWAPHSKSHPLLYTYTALQRQALAPISSTSAYTLMGGL